MKRTSIFQTHVACKERLCTLIIDRDSCFNLTLDELVKKLNLKIEEHPNPYQIAWVNDERKCKKTPVIFTKVQLTPYAFFFLAPNALNVLNRNSI